jgi:glucosylceramidase
MSRSIKRAWIVTAFMMGCVFSGFRALAWADTAVWVCSMQSRPWQLMPAPVIVQTLPQPADIRVIPGRAYQSIDGFGGAFNELGWKALGNLPTGLREVALKELFGDQGCALNLGRIPIGASDYARSAYSLDDTPEDFELKDFSIARDREMLLPYVKGAMGVRPGLRCWGSAWSPPAWMKTNGNYSGGAIRDEPRVLGAYADYLARWVRAYRAEGVNVYAITPQNEPNILNVYPTCLWSGATLREFIGDYLGPRLEGEHVELWLGINGDPPNDGHNANDRLAAVMDDAKASSRISGIAFQYDSQNQMRVARELYPDKKLMQSESECDNGANSWGDAQKLFQLMKRYLENGASSYFAWNMVLDETGMSTWKWKQNTLITADAGKQQLRLNGEYFVMRHFSGFVKPGARRVMTVGPWEDRIGFVNPDGSVVIVVGNSRRETLLARIEIGGEGMEVMVPGESISTFVVGK